MAQTLAPALDSADRKASKVIKTASRGSEQSEAILEANKEVVKEVGAKAADEIKKN